MSDVAQLRVQFDPVTFGRRVVSWNISLTCPHCGGTHVHNSGDDGMVGGLRRAPCSTRAAPKHYDIPNPVTALPARVGPRSACPDCSCPNSNYDGARWRCSHCGRNRGA